MKPVFFPLMIVSALLTPLISWPEIYIVKQGDSLSKIAGRSYPGPVWGSAGSFRKILALNPKAKPPFLLRPGDRIELGDLSSKNTSRAPAHAPPPPPLPVPSLTSAPDPAPSSHAPPTENTSNPFSQLGMEFGTAQFRIDAQDRSTQASATFLSDTNIAARLTWDLQWTSEWMSRLRWSTQVERIKNATSSSVTWNEGDGARTEFEAGLLRSWSKRSRSSFTIAQTVQIYERSISSSNITFDRIPTVAVRLGQQLDVVCLGTATAGISGEAGLLLPASGVDYSTENGYTFLVKGHLEHRFGSWAIRGEAFYGVAWQGSSFLDQTHQNVGSYFGLFKKFGD